MDLFDKTKTYFLRVIIGGMPTYYTGKIVEENETHIVIRTVKGEIARIPKDNLERAKVQGDQHE